MMARKISVLIVDDNENFSNRLVDLLGESETVGCIQTATNCMDAFRLLDNKLHDVLLLDINLPGQSGFSLLEKIRELGWTCKVIMVTNHSSDSYRIESSKLGAWSFIDKTCEFDRLPALIDAVN